MKLAFKKAFKIYLILLAVYTAIYWPLVIIDDWGFIEEYWNEHWLSYIGLWFAFYAVFFIIGSLFYWIPVPLLILLFRNSLPENDQYPNSEKELDQVDFDR